MKSWREAYNECKNSKPSPFDWSSHVSVGFKAGWDAREAEIPKAAEGWEEAYGKFRDGVTWAPDDASFRAGWEAAMAAAWQAAMAAAWQKLEGFGIGTSELRQEEERQKNQAAADAVNRMGAIVGAPVLSMDLVSGDALQQIREELDIDGLAEAVQRLERNLENLKANLRRAATA